MGGRGGEGGWGRNSNTLSHFKGHSAREDFFIKYDMDFTVLCFALILYMYSRDFLIQLIHQSIVRK